MATLHVSQSDLAADLSALLERVRNGDEIFIEGEEDTFAMLVPADPTAPGFDPEYDALVSAKLQASMDDPRPGISSEAVEAYFTERKRLSSLAMQENGE